MSEEIKNIIEKYIKIDDELKVLAKQRTPLAVEKKMLSEQISNYLQSKESGGGSPIALKSGDQIFKIKRQSRKSINKNNVEEILARTLKDEAQVSSILEDIMEEKEMITLTRSSGK
jgi:hypothetical protein